MARDPHRHHELSTRMTTSQSNVHHPRALRASLTASSYAAPGAVSAQRFTLWAMGIARHERWKGGAAKAHLPTDAVPARRQTGYPCHVRVVQQQEV
jgi:hypothetical protein